MKTTHRTSRRLFVFLPVVLIAVSTRPTLAGNITYSIFPRTLPFVLGSDEAYPPPTGSMTTNGTFGTLSASDIIDYRIEVSGRSPHIFARGDPDFQVNVAGELNADENGIFLSYTGEGDSHLAIRMLGVSSRLPGGSESPEIWWIVGPGSYWQIHGSEVYWDGRADAQYETPHVLGVGDTFLVATIPEPTTVALLFLGAVILLARHRALNVG